MPNWSPLVVCCDDEEAFAYAQGELMVAGRGAAIHTRQGEYFSRLEAIRLGVHALERGIDSRGGSFLLQLPEALPSADFFGSSVNLYNGQAVIPGRIAVFDADTIALGPTEGALEQIDDYSVGICKLGARHNMGFICASAATIQAGISLTERDSFHGYGFEDNALRVGCWAATGGAFVHIHPCWARIGHTDAVRNTHYREPPGVSSKKNASVLGRLIAKVVDRDRWDECIADCLPGQKFTIAGGDQ